MNYNLLYIVKIIYLYTMYIFEYIYNKLNYIKLFNFILIIYLAILKFKPDTYSFLVPKKVKCHTIYIIIYNTIN